MRAISHQDPNGWMINVDDWVLDRIRETDTWPTAALLVRDSLDETQTQQAHLQEHRRVGQTYSVTP
jgi:hypothetical protein